MRYFYKLWKFRRMCKKLLLTEVNRTTFEYTKGLYLTLEPDGAMLLDLPDGSKQLVKLGDNV